MDNWRYLLVLQLKGTILWHIVDNPKSYHLTKETHQEPRFSRVPNPLARKITRNQDDIMIYNVLMY